MILPGFGILSKSLTDLAATVEPINKAISFIYNIIYKYNGNWPRWKMNPIGNLFMVKKGYSSMSKLSCLSTALIIGVFGIVEFNLSDEFREFPRRKDTLLKYFQ